MPTLLAFIVWHRARRQFGRQPVRRGAMVAQAAVLAAMAGLLSLAGLRGPRLLDGLAVACLPAPHRACSACA